MNHVIILEGPDGGGKTTLAHELSRKMGSALFTHCGAFPNLTSSQLAATYEAAVAPALDGTCDVILDRCWLSERPYGIAFRGGKYRLPTDFRSAIERRLVETTKPLLILCLPPLETCLDVFRARPREEYLKNQQQLALVYAGYLQLQTDLPTWTYDRTKYPSKERSLNEALGEIERRVRK